MIRESVLGSVLLLLLLALGAGQTPVEAKVLLKCEIVDVLLRSNIQRTFLSNCKLYTTVCNL